jgi:OmpA-OmpF porin, OOP family
MFFRLTFFIATLLVTNAAFADPADYTELMKADADGAADSAFTGRYEGSTIVGQTFSKFDELALPAGPADVKAKEFTKMVTQKGTVQRTLYVAPEERSSLDVFSNYIDAIKAKGFNVVFECEAKACGANFKDLKYKWNDAESVVISETANDRRKAVSRGMFSKIVDPRYALLSSGDAGQETYIAVFAGQNMGGSSGDISKALRGRVGVLIEVVEPRTREDKIITLTADQLGTGLNADGRVVIYGLYFDFDQATIKPESAPQLDEMVAYLKAEAKASVYVVGHTDSKGKLDYNITLSTARAEAVTAALVKAGINADRLSAKGLGPLAPLTTNQTEDGQAKNRRVELVAQ